MVNQKRNKRSDVLNLLLSVVIIGLLNFVAASFFTRFDLTQEKRYTLSPATKNLLKNLDDVVFFKVYLEGDFPPGSAGLVRLKNSTREMLEEFRALGGSNIEYEFINPTESKTKKEQGEIFQQLASKGLQPTFFEIKTKEGTSQQTIFPCAIATYKNKEIPVQLLREQLGVNSEEVLNNSVQGLEYELSNAIRKMQVKLKPMVGFVQGHKELDSLRTSDIQKALAEYYEVRTIHLGGKLNDLEKINEFSAIIIAKPDTFFSEQDKFIIDQFVMGRGKVLWLIDNVFASMDSLQTTSTTYGIPRPLNLDDQLFKYGVRINNNMVLDIKSGAIPIPVNKKYELLPWFYFPLVGQSNNHPIVNNMNAVRCEFASSIDTIGVRGIKKTFLLSTSKYSRLLNTPVRIDIRSAFRKPDESMFNKSSIPVAVLLEGNFESVFKNRLPPEMDSIKQIKFIDKCTKPNKMIVVSDGDIIKNAIQQSTGKSYPLGYDIWTQQTFGNKNFILNCMNYLCDESELISIRSRELKLRLLDKKIIESQKIKWQLTNTILPLLFILLFGMLRFVLRKRKFTR